MATSVSDLNKRNTSLVPSPIQVSTYPISRVHASSITCPRIEYHVLKVKVEWNRAPTIIQSAFHAFRIKKELDNHKIIMLVSMDLSKAFDTLPH